MSYFSANLSAYWIYADQWRYRIVVKDGTCVMDGGPFESKRVALMRGAGCAAKMKYNLVSHGVLFGAELEVEDRRPSWNAETSSPGLPG